MTEKSIKEHILGSFAYHPPEHENKSIKKHGRSFEIWSMGYTCVELIVLVAYGREEQKARRI